MRFSQPLCPLRIHVALVSGSDVVLGDLPLFLLLLAIAFADVSCVRGVVVPARVQVRTLKSYHLVLSFMAMSLDKKAKQNCAKPCYYQLQPRKENP